MAHDPRRPRALGPRPNADPADFVPDDEWRRLKVTLVVVPTGTCAFVHGENVTQHARVVVMSPAPRAFEIEVPSTPHCSDRPAVGNGILENSVRGEWKITSNVRGSDADLVVKLEAWRPKT